MPVTLVTAAAAVIDVLLLVVAVVSLEVLTVTVYVPVAPDGFVMPRIVTFAPT